MTRKPIKLEWNLILPEKEGAAPPLELEVVPTPAPVPASASVFESSSSPMEQQLTVGQLEEKILRIAKYLESVLAKNLPDKGQKLRAHLRVLQEQLHRRKLAQIHKTAENCETITDYKATECSVAPNNSLHAIAASECNTRSTFFSMFNQKLDDRAGSVFMGNISSEKSCQIHERTNLCRTSSHSSTICSRQTPFPPTNKAASMEKKRSFNANCNSFKTSSFYAPCTERRCSKRLKNSEGWGTSILRSKKVHDVVLLDEEDVQPKDPIRKEAKMYYPSRDHPESVELSYSDLKCLEPEQYISSPIMNFYIRYLQRPVSPVNRTKGEYYFFNTYFFGKLEEALASKGDRSSRLSKLRRWWKGVNMFEKAYIFLPIHKDLHWSLVIISIPPKEDESRPIILHLDSLGLHNSLLIFEVIQCYLTEEWKYVKQNATSPDIPTSEKILIDLPLMIVKKEIKSNRQGLIQGSWPCLGWKSRFIIPIVLYGKQEYAVGKVPQQKNEYDCGLFVLYFMERFIEEAPQRLKRKDLSMFGSKWFQPEDASGLRKRIKGLLLEEFESSMLELGREECRESPSSSSEADQELNVG